MLLAVSSGCRQLRMEVWANYLCLILGHRPTCTHPSPSGAEIRPQPPDLLPRGRVEDVQAVAVRVEHGDGRDTLLNPLRRGLLFADLLHTGLRLCAVESGVQFPGRVDHGTILSHVGANNLGTDAKHVHRRTLQPLRHRDLRPLLRRHGTGTADSWVLA